MSAAEERYQESQHLLCALSGEWYAFELTQVAAVVAVGDITPVPGAPAHIVGVQNLQGRLLAVLDIAGYLGLDASMGRHVVVLRHGKMSLGCLVDRAEDLVGIAGDVLQESPETHDRRRCVRSKVRVGERLVGLLDAEALVREVAGQ
jgi:purine-binding chemotaxis protein CheW